MCKQPVHILNPKLDFTLRDRLSLDVPCGHCSECVERKRNDYFIRCFYQYIENKKKGGVTLYYTLTYNNENLPTYDGKPVFNKRNVQLFLKRFRKAFNKDASTYTNISYFVTSEFGDKRKRPHHHGLVFIPVSLSYFDIEHTKKLIADCWQYGFVSFGEPNDKIKHLGVVQSEQALHYCCKYISKDMDYDYQDKLIPKEYQPFHLQSKGLGQYMIKYFGFDTYTSKSIQLLVNGTISLGDEDTSLFTYSIPQYITRKVLYDYIYEKHDDGTHDVKFLINEVGRHVMRERELLSVEKQAQDFEAIFNSVETIVHQHPSRIGYLNHRLGTDFENATEIKTYIRLNCEEYYHLAIYARVFKERIYIPRSDYDLECPDDKYDYEHARRYLDWLYSYDLDFVRKVYDQSNNKELELNRPYKTDEVRREWVYNKLSEYSFAQCFPVEYELLIEIYNTLTFFIGIDKDREFKEKEKKYRDAKLLVAKVL